MTSKNMAISRKYDERIPDLLTMTHFSTTYDTGIISQADAFEDGILFTFTGGEQRWVDLSGCLPLDIVYLAQFGISVTDDGEYFFLQSWEDGLFCFSARTGQCLWQMQVKRASEIVVYQNTVICRFGQGLCKFSIPSGEHLSTYPISEYADFLPISDSRFLVGPRRKKYCILDEHLQEIAKIPEDCLNPNSFDHFVLQDAQLTRDGLRITGVEHSSAALAQAIGNHSVDQLDELGKFERIVIFP